MPLAHVLLGLFGATAAATWACFGAGASVWTAALIYMGVGNAICLTSVAVALLRAARNEQEETHVSTVAAAEVCAVDREVVPEAAILWTTGMVIDLDIVRQASRSRRLSAGWKDASRVVLAGVELEEDWPRQARGGREAG